ncbi:MAG: transporter [Rhodoferax sp.]|nr:transporter [Rhodoferax sp.]
MAMVVPPPKAAMAPSRPPPTAASSHFSSFLLSLFCSRLADQLLLFLVPLVVFQTTQDAAWSGIAFAVESFPRFLSFPICGALCDRFAPVTLMRQSQVLRAVACVAGAACGAAFGGVGWLVGVSAVCGVLTTQGAMAREVILPQAFGEHRFEKVLAYAQTADQLGAVIGPVVAALLLAQLHWPAAMAVTAGIFLLADLALSYWRRRSAVSLRPRRAGQGMAADLMNALGHVVRLPTLRRLVVQAAGVNLVVGVTLASSAALVVGRHGQTASQYGVLQAAGAVVTVLVLMGIAHRAVAAWWLGSVGFGAMVLGGLMTGLGSGIRGYACGYLLVIGFDKMFNIYLRSSRQRVIPAADYGKTAGVMAMLNNLSQPLAGLAIAAFSATWSASAVILALTLAMAALGALSLLAGREPAKTRS